MVTTKFSLELIEEENFDSIGMGDSPDAVWHALRKVKLNSMPEEHMYVLFLNNRLEIVGVSEVAHGGVSEMYVDVSNIFKRALLCNAKNIILAHNHPSGGMIRPSNQDIALTERVRDAGNVIGINLLDHMIVSTDGYYSMLEHDEEVMKCTK